MRKRKNEDKIVSLLEQMEGRDKNMAQRLQKLQQQITEGSDGNVVKLRKVLVAAKDKLKEQNELLRRITSMPFVIATVIRIDGESLKKAKLQKIWNLFLMCLCAELRLPI